MEFVCFYSDHGGNQDIENPTSAWPGLSLRHWSIILHFIHILPLLFLGFLLLLQPECLDHDGLISPHCDRSQAARHCPPSGRGAYGPPLILGPQTTLGGHCQSGLLSQRPGWVGGYRHSIIGLVRVPVISSRVLNETDTTDV